MSYNSNIPLATDLISVSQGDLLNNFTSMQNTFTTDHFGFNPVANIGFHKHVTLPDQTSSPPTTAASQMAIYAKTTATITSPYYRRDGLATDIPVSPIKAFMRIVGASGATIGTALNLSVVRNSVGIYTFTPAVGTFSDNNYLPIAMVDAVGLYAAAAGIGATCQIVVRQAVSGIVQDPTSLSVLVLEFA